MNKIAEFSAQMICYLWFAEPSTLRRSFYQQQQDPQQHHALSSPSNSPPQPTCNASSSSNTPNINQAQLVPNPEFVMFIHNLLHTTQVSHSVVLLALFYIHRLKSLNPIKPNSKSEYRIGVVSLMLANKMLDDHTYTAKTWSEVSRLPLNSLNDGEIEFLKGLNFELHVNICDFSAWFKLLHGMVHLKDQHTAMALASGPRTRWFKKMRVASGEGLDVLEGLISPIRNSKMMKMFEVEKEQKQRALPPPREHLEPPPSTARFQAQPIHPQNQQPSHPYNLRRSTRAMVVSSTHTTPIQQFPSWGGSPSSVSSAYSAIVPRNALSMTPRQQMELRERQIASLPSKTRTIQYLPVGYPTRVDTGSTKRNLAEFLSSQRDPNLYAEDGINRLNARNKRLSSSISASTSTATASSSSSRIPSSVATTMQMTPNSQQLLNHQLAPILAATQATTHANYLASGLMPSQQQHPYRADNDNENRPKLCFRSIVAGRRGAENQVVVAQGENGLVSYVAASSSSKPCPDQANQVEMENNKRMTPHTNWFYSNFSNAGVPGVVWAERSSSLQNRTSTDVNDRFLTNVPSQPETLHDTNHPPTQHYPHHYLLSSQVNLSSASSSLWHLNHHQHLPKPF